MPAGRHAYRDSSTHQLVPRSSGAVALDVTTRDMVTNITTVFNSTQTITYVLSATVAAGVIPIQTRTVTITVLNYP